MRVGGAVNPWSSHQAGMSALWHDADYLPEQRFETPRVQRGLDDMALPSEQHQLPEGVPDPFDKMEKAFDVAAEQMERGMLGAAFLHGSKRPTDAANVEHTPSRGVERAAATKRQEVKHADHPAAIDQRRETMRQRGLDEAAAVAVPNRVQGASKTAAEKEAEKAGGAGGANAGDLLGVAATFLPTAAGNAVQSVVQGPLPAMAAQATSIAGAVLSAGQVGAIGVAEGLKEEEPVTVRRGLRRAPTTEDDLTKKA